MQCLQSLLRQWERLQVELQGQYSIARFEALVQYQAHHTSLLRALAIAILGPLPLLVLIISVDAMPLVPASDGYYNQKPAFWVRVFLVGWFTPFTLIYQTWIVAPVLPMTTTRMCTIMAISGLYTCVVSVVLDLFFSFPIPFSIHFEAGPFLSLLSTALWLSWKDALRTDPVARLGLKRCVKVLATQIIMLEIYVGFNLAFHQLHGVYQTLLSGLLPPIKLLFKNCISRGVFHLEDLSPTVVVFFVDVFHALFVSVTMQQASSNGANIVVMVVDVAQICVAYFELSQVLARIHALIDLDETYSSQKVRLQRDEPSSRPTVSVINYAAYVLRTDKTARSHPHIALPRHSRGSDTHVIVFTSQRFSSRLLASVCRVSPSIDDIRTVTPTGPEAPCLADRVVSSRLLSQHSLHRVECAKAVLKLLHMIEFYVLVEYVEAMLSVGYGACLHQHLFLKTEVDGFLKTDRPLFCVETALYMLILSYLPSHKFYTQLSGLSSSELRTTAWHVGMFAATEVLSLMLFCVVVDRKVANYSTLRQLAFALESNGKLIYAVTVGWVFMIVQFGFVLTTAVGASFAEQ